MDGALVFEGHDAPERYAKHLASYLRDSTTVRARTMEEFGRAPSIERIESYRAEHDRLKARPFNTYLSARYDSQFEKPERKKAPRPKPKAHPAPVFDLPPWKRCGTNGEDVVEAVSKAFGLTPGDIRGRSREDYIARVRQLIAVLLMERGNSSVVVGRFIGRDHSTVLHAKEVLPGKMRRHPALAEAYVYFRQEWGLAA